MGAKGKGAAVESVMDESRMKEINARRAEFALMASSTERWIWVTDPEQAFVPAKILKENADGSMEVEVGVSRTVKVVKKAEIGPYITRLAELKNHVDGKLLPQYICDLFYHFLTLRIERKRSINLKS
jgi:Myosin N-terminal SH3-like domain